MEEKDFKIRIKNYLREHTWTALIIWTFCLNLVIECLARRSILDALIALVSRPAVFLINVFILLAVISFGMLFRRRKFMLFFLSFLCGACALADFVVRFFRKTPVTMEDIRVIDDGLRVAPKYIGYVGIVLIFAVIIAFVIFLIVSFIRADKIRGKRNMGSIVLRIGLCVVLAILSVEIGLRTHLLESSFGNLPEAFANYGFVYCFGNSIVNRGISKPSDYSEDTIREIVNEVEAEENTLSVDETVQEKRTKVFRDDKVNVVFVQLESFMDPNLVKDVTYSTNPVPYFTYLKNEFPSGYLYMPCFGMGTVNSEFEVLTGMNLDDFGAGEYPYKTFLLTTPCETTAYNWKEEGYATHVLHNNDGTFYARNKVFPNMGIDDFTSIEYMNNVERNPVGWAKDKTLVSEVMEVLKGTEENDFIYMISVQAHGDYPSDLEPQEGDITFTGFPYEEETNQWSYYINQVREVDEFLMKLTEAFNEFDEKVVLVAYGDHLPGFSFEGDDLVSGDIYSSEYFIWSNYGLMTEDRDMEAYELSAHTANLLDNHHGMIAQYHQTSGANIDYLDGLKLLEYDYLYGNQDSLTLDIPYSPTDMKMGHKEITVSNVYNFNQHFCVEGENFTDYSVVLVNGKEQETLCVSAYVLVVQNKTLEPGDTVTVAQIGEDRAVLSETAEYTFVKK